MIDEIKRKNFTSSIRLTKEQVIGPDLMNVFLVGYREISLLMRFLAGRWE